MRLTTNSWYLENEFPAEIFNPLIQDKMMEDIIIKGTHVGLMPDIQFSLYMCYVRVNYVVLKGVLSISY